jgi:hypothetical protein
MYFHVPTLAPAIPNAVVLYTIPKGSLGSRRDPGSRWMLNQALQGTDRALADLRLVGFRALAPRVSFKEPHEVIPDFMPHPPWDFLGFKMCLIITS